MNKFAFSVAAALALGLAACSEQKTEAPASAPAQESAPAKTEAPPPATKPAATSASADDTQALTEKACLDGVAKETGESNVSVTSYEFSEANSLVMVAVGAQRAPWRCLVSNDGAVQEVMFTGDDSAGVDQPAPPAENTATADDGGGAMSGSSQNAQPASSSDVSDAAQQACLAAVSNETNEGDVAVLSSEFSEANSLVMVGVGADRAPWRCLVANDGAVQEVSFAGSEGRL